jgi:hypothetical protein
MGETVVLTERSRDMLERLAKAKGVSREEALEDALDLDATFVDVRENGGRILVEKGGHVQELAPA